MNILIISNLDSDEKLEDIWIARAFQKDGHQVCITGIDFDEKLDDVFDVFIKRNTWFSDENERDYYHKKAEILNKRIKQKNLLRINFDGKFDQIDKSYLIELFKNGYNVVPTIDSWEDLKLLPDTEFYLLKLKVGADGIGQKKLKKDELNQFLNDKYVVQPFIKFKSEVQFYFINNEFQYALEFKPSKIPVYPDAEKYEYSEDELVLAKSFASLNEDFYGIQRIDFLKLENGDLKLIEIEDASPYLDLDCVDNKTKENFICNYKEMVYKKLEL